MGKNYVVVNNEFEMYKKKKKIFLQFTRFNFFFQLIYSPTYYINEKSYRHYALINTMRTSFYGNMNFFFNHPNRRFCNNTQIDVVTTRFIYLYDIVYVDIYT